MNLNERWLPMPPLDLVFIRNVLIYFGVDTRKKILERIGTMMRPDGHLFVGASETPLNLVSCFEKLPVGKTSTGQFSQSAIRPLGCQMGTVTCAPDLQSRRDPLPGHRVCCRALLANSDVAEAFEELRQITAGLPMTPDKT